MAEQFNKYRCAASSGSYLYWVQVVATNEESALNMSRLNAKDKWGSTYAQLDWGAELQEKNEYGPARVLDSDYTRI
jgi:hypothetical protein